MEVLLYIIGIHSVRACLYAIVSPYDVFLHYFYRLPLRDCQWQQQLSDGSPAQQSTIFLREPSHQVMRLSYCVKHPLSAPLSQWCFIVESLLGQFGSSFRNVALLSHHASVFHGLAFGRHSLPCFISSHRSSSSFVGLNDARRCTCRQISRSTQNTSKRAY
jgi:hypothetical protein